MKEDYRKLKRKGCENSLKQTYCFSTRRSIEIPAHSVKIPDYRIQWGENIVKSGISISILSWIRARSWKQARTLDVCNRNMFRTTFVFAIFNKAILDTETIRNLNFEVVRHVAILVIKHALQLELPLIG
jgi:hypothetical protein